MPIVQHGLKDSSKDFPTANIEFDCQKGVYLCETNYGYGLAICIKANKLEVHIMGFNEDIYGKNLEIKNMKEINKKKLFEMALVINQWTLELICKFSS